MPTDTSVKFLHSAMVGAPSLNGGQAGSLLGLLDACLIDGFNLVTVDSLIVAGGIGTITRGGGLTFEVGAVVLIAGAAIAGGSVNGPQKILTATATTATFDAAGLADQTATGSITAKIAPLGWSKPFSGTNLAVYKSSDVASTGCYLRIDDSTSLTARARGFESMSDINTGAGLFPRDANVSGGLYWPKSNAADATSRNWVLVGDSRIFYLMVAYGGAGQATYGFNAVFGDINAVKSPDAYACVIHGLPSSALGTAGNNGINDFDDCNGGISGSATYMPRSYTGLGSDIWVRRTFPFITGGTAFKSGSSGLPYPNYADGGLYLANFNLIDHGTAVYRGAAPGLYGIPHNVGAGVFVARDLLAGVTGFDGKSFRVIGSAVGAFAFDVTGPWR